MSEYQRSASPNGTVSPVAHDIAAASIYGTTFEDTDPRLAIASIQAEQRQTDPKTFDMLLETGLFLIPLDQSDRLSDDTTFHYVYAVGMNLALATLDSICDQHDIDIDMFRNAWRLTGLVTMLDTTHENIRDLNTRERNEAVATGIMALGHQSLDRIGSTYDGIIEAAGTIAPEIAANPGVLRSSFGYVLGGGLSAINKILKEYEVRQFTEQLESEAQLIELLSRPFDESRQVDRLSSIVPTDHAALAEDIDTKAFYQSESADEYLAHLIEIRFGNDHQSVDMLHTLALVSYSENLDTLLLDETGRAFFYGGLLGLDTVLRQPGVTSLDEKEVLRTWRGRREHMWLNGGPKVVDERSVDVHRHLVEVLDREVETVAYDALLLKISDSIGHGADQAEAFHAGFRYGFLTGNDAVRLTRGKVIGKQVKDETMDIDEEIRRLLEG